jgi:hypothetical protein
MRITKTSTGQSADLKQHFQNYFELLLGAERSNLQRTIALSQGNTVEQLSSEVELSIAYLKGAVRMGKLLCLISSEEAKVKHEILMSERGMLLDCCIGRRTSP